MTNFSSAAFYSVETINGTALAGEDYKPFSEDVSFAKNEELRQVYIEIVDDFEWEPDEFFFVKLSVPPQEDGSHEHVALGNVSINQVTIINDDGKVLRLLYLFFCNRVKAVDPAFYEIKTFADYLDNSVQTQQQRYVIKWKLRWKLQNDALVNYNDADFSLSTCIMFCFKTSI